MRKTCAVADKCMRFFNRRKCDVERLENTHRRLFVLIRNTLRRDRKPSESGKTCVSDRTFTEKKKRERKGRLLKKEDYDVII